MTRARRGVLLSGVVALALAACGPAPGPPPTAFSSLKGAVARAAGVAIPSSLVTDVAQAKGVSAREAVDDLLADALAAQGALALGFDRDPGVSWPRTVAVARRTPTRLFEDARALGPPTDDELARVSVVHAVVLRSPSLREEDALAIAAAIRRAVVGSRGADDFEARAKAVSRPHAQVTVERVGPFGADGRDAEGTEFEAGFVAAAFTLHAPLETSPIVATPFGWHVLQLVERAAPEGPLADLRRDLAEAVVEMRARIRLENILTARRQSAPVEISVAADDLMSVAARP